MSRKWFLKHISLLLHHCLHLALVKAGPWESVEMTLSSVDETVQSSPPIWYLIYCPQRGCYCPQRINYTGSSENPEESQRNGVKWSHAREFTKPKSYLQISIFEIELVLLVPDLHMCILTINCLSTAAGAHKEQTPCGIYHVIPLQRKPFYH